MVKRSVEQIISQVEFYPYLQIEKPEFEQLLRSCNVYTDHDTIICDHIRILLCSKHILVQETTPKDEILLRHFKSIKSAEEFINRRMIIYDKMWDGCGCKIDYFA